MVGSNANYYDAINKDQSTALTVTSAGINATSESSGNAFSINMEEGDLAPTTIP